MFQIILEKWPKTLEIFSTRTDQLWDYMDITNAIVDNEAWDGLRKI